MARSMSSNAIEDQPSSLADWSYQKRGAVCTNWPTSAGKRGLDEKIGASVVRPLGLQNPLVVHSVKGHSTSSSLIILKML